MGSQPVRQQDQDHWSQCEDSSFMAAKSPAKNPVVRQVKILKRGEVLGLEKREEDLDMILGSTARLGPEPEMVQKQLRISKLNYVGSNVFESSPSPRSVPFPRFLNKNSTATSWLRQLVPGSNCFGYDIIMEESDTEDSEEESDTDYSEFWESE